MRHRRVLVISDLHLGGPERPMLSHPEYLAEFLGQVAAYAHSAEEDVELVINGDFVDFLAEPPFAAWNPDESAACTILDNVAKRYPVIFDQLKIAAQQLSRLTITLGNHDVELALPGVRAHLSELLGSSQSTKLHLITSNEAYRVGDLLIEHGNRYDAWNAIDYDGLRHTISCLSRGERVPSDSGMQICPGSRMVEKVITILKPRYTFIDLLKPETKIVSFLLTALEPTLYYDLPILYRISTSYIDQWVRSRPWLNRVEDSSRLLARSNAEMPADANEAFAQELDLAGDQDRLLSAGDSWGLSFSKLRPESLYALIKSQKEIPEARLRKLQVGLKYTLDGDRTFQVDGSDGPYYEAAQRLASIANPPKVVLMGHTHHRREVIIKGDQKYVNTGTWVDIIQVPGKLLEPQNLPGFEAWLRNLVLQPENLREPTPTFADLRLDGNQKVMTPGNGEFLRTFSPGSAL